MYLTIKELGEKYPNVSGDVIFDIYHQTCNICLAKLNEVIVGELQIQLNNNNFNKEIFDVLIDMNKKFKEDAYRKDDLKNMADAGIKGALAGCQWSLCYELVDSGASKDDSVKFIKKLMLNSNNNYDFCKETIKIVISIARANPINIETLMNLSDPFPVDDFKLLWDIYNAVGALSLIGITKESHLKSFAVNYYRNVHRWKKENMKS